MTTRKQRDFIKVQLIEVQRLLENIEDHPIMSFAFKMKEEDLNRQLEELPVDKKEAKVLLMFSGNPVKGSIGIDAQFAGRVVIPFQNMVKSDFAQRMHGNVGERGRINSEEHSKLFITALPRGSFGIELTKLDNDSLFDEDQLADSLSRIAKLVESSGKSDEDFVAELDEAAPRTIQYLRDFLDVISHDQAGITIESGGIRCVLEQSQVQSAFKRVAETETNEERVELNGELKGVLLQSWRFDFVSEENLPITGKIAEGLTEETVSTYDKQYFNHKCIAVLQKSRVMFKNGRERVNYTLIEIKSIEPSQDVQ